MCGRVIGSVSCLWHESKYQSQRELDWSNVKPFSVFLEILARRSEETKKLSLLKRLAALLEIDRINKFSPFCTTELEWSSKRDPETQSILKLSKVFKPRF